MSQAHAPQVLLPPRTALIYSYLLKAEASELNKDQTAAWDKIMQIRHLKDRMIRKCQRLARAATPKDKNTGRMALFTLHAPPDFRLKEMERWFRNQGSEFLQLVSGGSATTYCCSKCGPLGLPNMSSRHATAPSTRTATATRTPIPRASAPSTRAPTPTRDRNRASHRPPTASATPSTTERTRTSSTTSKQAPVPERAHKRPSDSSSKTVDPDPEPRYVIIRADLTTTSEATLSRSNSARSNPPAHAAHATPAVPHSQVPAVIRQPDTPPTASPPRSVEQLRTPRSRSRSPLQAVLEQHPPRASVQSPEPLPIPYRPARESAPRGDLEDVEELVTTGSPQLMAREEELSAEELSEPRHYEQDHFEQLRQPMEELRALSPDGTLVSSSQNDPIPFPTTGQPLETIHERPESELSVPPQRPLIRRRSSLKKRDSMSRLSVASQSKSVTWAMDRDWTEQMSKFVKTTNEAEVTGSYSLVLSRCADELTP